MLACSDARPQDSCALRAGSNRLLALRIRPQLAKLIAGCRYSRVAMPRDLEARLAGSPIAISQTRKRRLHRTPQPTSGMSAEKRRRNGLAMPRGSPNDTSQA